MDLLDNPLVQSILFYPRPDQAGGSVLPNVYDGTIPVDEGSSWATGCMPTSPARP